MVTSSPVTNHIEIVGVVSWGNGCARKGFPGSYANVIKYKEFIEKTIAAGECVTKANQILQKKAAVTTVNASTLSDTSATVSSKINIPGVSDITVDPQRKIEAVRALSPPAFQPLPLYQAAVPRASEARPNTIASQLNSNPVLINGRTGK